MQAAVLGCPVGHSLSPVLHRAAYQALGLADWCYEAIECDEARLPGRLGECGPGWAGLSLTMPLKRAVLGLLDHTEPLAVEVGAANTVVFRDGARYGYNTDVPGMISALTEAGLPGPGSGPPPARVLILGAGATACSALAALRGLGTREVTVAARDKQRAEGLLAAADRLGVAVLLIPFDTPGEAAPELLISTASKRASRARAPPRRRAPPTFMPNGSTTVISSPVTCSTSCITRGRRGWPGPRSVLAPPSRAGSACCCTRRRSRSC